MNAKDGFVKNEYEETIKSYIQKGYLRKLTPEEMSSPSCWYLPHFPIVKLEKTTTKVRIVFDCSAKYEGVSLNDAIYAGPKLQTELFDVLVRFRRNPIGIACDIKQMYLQIEIEEKDRLTLESCGGIMKATESLTSMNLHVSYSAKTRRRWKHNM